MTALVIVGMHRSGTSALAKSLANLGAWVGSKENITPRGEHALMQQCNQALMNGVGGHWSAPIGFETSEWLASRCAQGLRSLGAEAVADFVGHDVFAWKDPRNCFTRDFWMSLLSVEMVNVAIYRHPLEVAASLAARNQFSLVHSLVLWETYNRGWLQHCTGSRTVVLPYSELSGHPARALSRVHEQLTKWDVPLDGDPADAAPTVDPQRRHHVIDVQNVDGLTDSQCELWQCLQTLDFCAESFERPRLAAVSPDSYELLQERARRIQAEREAAALRQQLRSRRVLLRRLMRRD